MCICVYMYICIYVYIYICIYIPFSGDFRSLSNDIWDLDVPDITELDVFSSEPQIKQSREAERNLA